MLVLSEPPIVALLAALVLTVVVVFLAAAWTGHLIGTRATRRAATKPVLPYVPPQVTLFLLDEDERSVLHRVKIDMRARKPVYHHLGQTYIASRACTGGFCYRKQVGHV